MTDTQVMAALEPIQADIEMAETICNKKDNPHMWAILCKKFAAHRIASSPAAEPVGGNVQYFRTCPRCNGLGGIGHGDAVRCTECHGNGVVSNAAPVPRPAGDVEVRKLLTRFVAWAARVDALDDDDEYLNGEHPDQRAAGRNGWDDLRDIAADALPVIATPPSVPAQQGWLPIETAPKDGAHFLATTIVRNTTTGKQWWETHVIWVDDETGELSADCDAGWSCVDDYTHWQPLPTPPSQDQKGEEG